MAEPLISLTQAKAQLNIESSFTADDTYIQSLIDAALKVTELEICQDIDDVLEEGALPSPLRHAALLLIGEWYAHREDVTDKTQVRIPHGFAYLTAKYRRYDQ